MITDALYFTETFIKGNLGAVKAVIAGYLDGLEFIKSHPDQAFENSGKHMGVTATEAKAQYPGAYTIPPAEMAQYFIKRDGSRSLYKVGATIGDLLVAQPGT